MALSSKTVSIIHRTCKLAIDGSYKRQYSNLSSLSSLNHKNKRLSTNPKDCNFLRKDFAVKFHKHDAIVTRFSSSSAGNKRYLVKL